MTSARRAWLLAAAVLALANPLLHKAVSDVCDWARVRWGFAFYDWAALVAIPLVSLLAAALLLRWSSRGLLSRPFGPMSLLILVVLTLAAQRWLLVANIELIHFPQFALLAVLLLAAGLSGVAAFLTAAFAGLLDETYQYFVIYAGLPGIYFDINDIVLNTIGAAWGVVVGAGIFGSSSSAAVGGAPPLPGEPSARRTVAARWTLIVVLLALPVALWLDPPTFSPLLRPTDSGRALFRVLSAPEGVVICAVLWGLVAFLAPDGARRRAFERPA